MILKLKALSQSIITIIVKFVFIIKCIAYYIIVGLGVGQLQSVSPSERHDLLVKHTLSIVDMALVDS